MKLKRSGWITDEEAMALLDGMEEKNVLRFPLEISEATAVVNTVKRYDSNAGRYKPHLLEVLRSKLNFSYASITMFVLWFQPGELKLSIVQCKKQRVKLEVKLAENSTPNWEEMRRKGMVRWFKY